MLMWWYLCAAAVAVAVAVVCVGGEGLRFTGRSLGGHCGSVMQARVTAGSGTRAPGCVLAGANLPPPPGTSAYGREYYGDRAILNFPHSAPAPGDSQHEERGEHEHDAQGGTSGGRGCGARAQPVTAAPQLPQLPVAAAPLPGEHSALHLFAVAAQAAELARPSAAGAPPAPPGQQTQQAAPWQGEGASGSVGGLSASAAASVTAAAVAALKLTTSLCVPARRDDAALPISPLRLHSRCAANALCRHISA